MISAQGTPGGALTGEAIKGLEIVVGGADDCYRHASYDLRIGDLIDPEGHIVEEYALPSRGIVEVISRERICVPSNVVGTAMVKTSLCNDGVLALGIGLIDPGWNGPISSYLINFSKNSHLLSRNDVFLRATFQRLDGPLPDVKTINKSHNEIISLRRKSTVTNVGSSFLNLSEELEKLSKEQENKRWLRLLAVITVCALILNVFGFVLTWFTSGLAGKPSSVPMVLSAPLANEVKVLRDQNDDLQKRLFVLERASSKSEIKIENGRGANRDKLEDGK